MLAIYNWNSVDVSSFLDKIAERLEESGIAYVRFDGRMSAKRRQETIAQVGRYGSPGHHADAKPSFLSRSSKTTKWRWRGVAAVADPARARLAAGRTQTLSWRPTMTRISWTTQTTTLSTQRRKARRKGKENKRARCLLPIRDGLHFLLAKTRKSC